MASPIPEDPYLALGVSKDADISVIRSAHRKLVLKFHPDRIKNEEDKPKAKDEFQKAQQAYELLSDPTRRTRYDDRIKLAELRKEAMMREPQIRTATYPSRRPTSNVPMPSPMPREYRDGAFFEERVPSGPFFDSRERYEEEPVRSSSRKYDDFDRRNSVKSSEKEKRNSVGSGNPTTTTSSSKWAKPAAGMSFEMAFNLKKKAAQAKERVSEKQRERENQNAKAKARDRDERRDRSDKESRRTFVVDADSSDSDTATGVSYATVRPSSKQSSRPKANPESARKRSPERNRSFRDDDDETYDDKWERHHHSVREYIQQSSQQRPGVNRSDSDAHQYWETEDRAYGRRSGSDSDRRPTSSKGRRSDMQVPKTRPPPPMQSHTSMPSNFRAHIEEREPMATRSSSNTTVPRERDHRREMPSISRSQTMPSRSRKDTAPSKGSNLKHTETQDSGYGSSSPHTPEMPSSVSPTREPLREPARESMRQSTRYQIVTPAEEHEEFMRGHRTILIDEEDRHRRTQSPPPRERDRRERSDRSDRPDRPKIVTEGRTRSSRVSSGPGPAERPLSMRHESSRLAQPLSPRDFPRDSPPLSRHNSERSKLFGEISTEERESSPQYVRRFAPDSVSTSPRIDADRINHGSYRRRDSPNDHDYFPGSRHRQELHEQPTSRRGSVY